MKTAVALALISVSALTPTVAARQAQGPGANNAGQSHFIQTDVVLVDVSVTDRTGQSVADLRLSDFKVLDNFVARPIETFHAVVGNSQDYYVVGYRAPEAPVSGEYRRINITVDRPGVHVNARAGYYAGQSQDEFARGIYPEDTPGLIAPVVKDRYQATYTSDAIRAKIQGSVVVDAVIGDDGKVLRTRVSTSSLDKSYGLDQEALNAVQRWSFTPGQLHGDNVPVLVKIVVGFRLH